MNKKQFEVAHEYLGQVASNYCQEHEHILLPMYSRYMIHNTKLAKCLVESDGCFISMNGVNVWDLANNEPVPYISKTKLRVMKRQDDKKLYYISRIEKLENEIKEKQKRLDYFKKQVALF